MEIKTIFGTPPTVLLSMAFLAFFFVVKAPSRADLLGVEEEEEEGEGEGEGEGEEGEGEEEAK